jgi:hypothetical protein
MYPPEIPLEVKRILVRARRELNRIFQQRAQAANMTPEHQRVLKAGLDAAAAIQVARIARYFAG